MLLELSSKCREGPMSKKGKKIPIQAHLAGPREELAGGGLGDLICFRRTILAASENSL